MAKQKWIAFGFARFNAEWVASVTLAQFIEHEKHHGLTAEQMKEIHETAKKVMKPVKVKKEKPEAKEDSIEVNGDPGEQ